MIKIRAFPKTSRKRFWNDRVIDWRLLDVNVGLSGRKKRSAQASAHPLVYRLRLFVSFCEFWLRLNEMHEVRTFVHCKGFLFFVFVVVVVFSSLENYFGFRTTNVRVKTVHSVSLKRNKTFWTFQEVCIFLIIVHSICDLILCPVLASPSFAGLN